MNNRARILVGKAVARYARLAASLSAVKASNPVEIEALTPGPKCYHCGHDKKRIKRGDVQWRCRRCQHLWPLIEARLLMKAVKRQRADTSKDYAHCAVADLSKIFQGIGALEWWLLVHREFGFRDRNEDGVFHSHGSYRELSLRAVKMFPEGRMQIGSEKACQRYHDKICERIVPFLN